MKVPGSWLEFPEVVSSLAYSTNNSWPVYCIQIVKAFLRSSCLMRWTSKHKECPLQWLATSVFKRWHQIICPSLRLTLSLKPYTIIISVLMGFVLFWTHLQLCFWYIIIRLGWNLSNSDASWPFVQFLKKETCISFLNSSLTDSYKGASFADAAMSLVAGWPFCWD